MEQEQINRDAVIAHIAFILDSSIARSSEVLRKLGVIEGEVENVMETENVSGGDNVNIQTQF